MKSGSWVTCALLQDLINSFIYLRSKKWKWISLINWTGCSICHRFVSDLWFERTKLFLSALNPMECSTIIRSVPALCYWRKRYHMLVRFLACALNLLCFQYLSALAKCLKALSRHGKFSSVLLPGCLLDVCWMWLSLYCCDTFAFTVKPNSAQFNFLFGLSSWQWTLSQSGFREIYKYIRFQHVNF